MKEFIDSIKSRKFLGMAIWFVIVQYFFWIVVKEFREPSYSHSIFYANMVFVLAYLGIQGFQDIKTDESGNFFDKKFIVAILQLVMVIETLVVNKYVSSKLGQPFDLSCTSEIIVNGGAALAAFCGIAWTKKTSETSTEEAPK